MLLFISQPDCKPLEVKDLWIFLSLDFLQKLEHSRHLEDVSKSINGEEKTSIDIDAKLEKKKHIMRPPEGYSRGIRTHTMKVPLLSGASQEGFLERLPGGWVRCRQESGSWALQE